MLLSETHSLTASTTKFALESGTQVTDHVIVNPAEVTVSFAMTNTGAGPDASRDVFETFKKMCDSREPVELITEHHVYENMIITSISPTHQAPYKGAWQMSISLQQVHFVTLESVGREPEQTKKGTPTAKTSIGKVNAGQQEPKKLEQPTEEKGTADSGSQSGIEDRA